MTWERQCNYTFQGSFTFIGFVLINVIAVPLQSFIEMKKVQEERNLAHCSLVG